MEKRHVKYKFLLLITGLLMCSCTSTYKAELKNEYVFNPDNKSYQELVNMYGAPVRIFSDGVNGYVAVFSGTNVFDYNVSKFGGTTPELQCYIENDTNICYKHKFANLRADNVFNPGLTVLLLLALILFIK